MKKMIGRNGEVWTVEASMLPFLFVLLLALSSRYATKTTVNRRFLALTRSAFAAAVLELTLLLGPWSYWLCTLSCSADILCVYELARYTVVCLRGDDGSRWRKINRAVLWAGWLCSLLNLFLVFNFQLDFCSRVHAGFSFFFLCEAIIFQVLYQKGDAHFLVMSLLFFLMLDAFVAQYLFVTQVLFAYSAATILLFAAFFYLEAPVYRAMTRAEAEVRAARRAAEESARTANAANRAKSDFLASTSHEIRTPMNAILGMNERILKEARDEPTRRAALSIRSAGRILLNVINNILDFSRFEAGKMELYEADYHLWDLLMDVDGSVWPDVRDKGLKFLLNVYKSLPDHLHGDATRLRQILLSLLDNAIKYTEKGSVSLNVTGERRAAGELFLRIAVSDTGIGIHEEDVKKLFRSFERVNLGETQSIRGIGLGLTLARRFLDLMGGQISVVSDYGKGSQFTVELSQKLALNGFQGTIQDYEEQKAASEEIPSGPWPDARILLVDDTPVNLVVAKGMLKETEAKVDTAESGEDALAMLGRARYDLVFLDHRMPGMDGPETLRRAKAAGGPSKDAAYIALTANASSPEEYRALGFDDYLPKPFQSEAMLALVAKYLAR